MTSQQLKLLKDQRQLALQKMALVAGDEGLREKYRAFVEEIDRRIAETR